MAVGRDGDENNREYVRVIDAMEEPLICGLGRCSVTASIASYGLNVIPPRSEGTCGCRRGDDGRHRWGSRHNGNRNNDNNDNRNNDAVRRECNSNDC